MSKLNSESSDSRNKRLEEHRKKTFLLKPLKGKITKKQIYGFDCETYGQKNKFYMGSIYGMFDKTEQAKVFYDKDEMKEFLLQRKFANKWLFATNIEFDFTRLFPPEEFDKFSILQRGGQILKFGHKNNKRHWNFLDSWNYAKISVEKMGDVIGIPKLDKPTVATEPYWRKPRTEEERKELELYNVTDSMITYKFVNFLFDTFINLNIQPKTTIASTAMNCWRRNNQPFPIFRMPIELMLDMFQGYSGGRCETISRGYIENHNYYDFNSLYPTVMWENEFPDPNTIRMNKKNEEYFWDYEGMSLVTISSPQETYLPYLSVRTDDKLLFPMYDRLKRWYSNIELREAVNRGYKVYQVHKNIYFKETYPFFHDYVQRMYDLRLEFQQQNSPMEFVCKLLLNSLYGKFAQKFDTDEKWIHKNQFNEKHQAKYDNWEEVGELIRMVRKEVRTPPLYVLPIFSIYSTALARHKLYEALEKVKFDAVYMDTDSIITKKTLEEGKKLGDLKKEYRIEKGIINRPKCYAFSGWDEKGEYKEKCKIKGFTQKMFFDDYRKFMACPTAKQRRFIKLKESQRRGLSVGEIKELEKTFSLEDTKRNWLGKRFDPEDYQDSEAVNIGDGRAI